MEELKTCPFCGNKVNIVINEEVGRMEDDIIVPLKKKEGIVYKHYFVHCIDCGMMTQLCICKTREDVITAWNRRSQGE